MRRNKKCKWNNKKANKSTKNNKQEPMQKQRKEKDTENKIDKRKRGILKKKGTGIRNKQKYVYIGIFHFKINIYWKISTYEPRSAKFRI